MDDYAGRVCADRYRLPLPPSDEFELAETRAFDTYSGQEVLVRQVLLPEVVDAGMLDEENGTWHRNRPGPAVAPARLVCHRHPAEPAVRRAIEAAQSAAQIPDHPRLDQVFDVFAEGGSLWVVSELVAARPLAALLAEQPLNPYRAAEIAADVLTALRVLHAHGWTHRNITARTVLICKDGRVVLTGLASGVAEEVLCGYDPVPAPVLPPEQGHDPAQGHDPERSYRQQSHEQQQCGGQQPWQGEYDNAYRDDALPAQRQAADADDPLPALRGSGPLDIRAARAGAIAAYRAGACAAARVSEVERHGDTGFRPVRHLDANTALRDGAGDQAAAGPAAPVYRGPATALAAERARQARIAVVGPVTERWAPEQAGPVHENWQLAPPIGPATDLWALGALLFRAVQGHAPVSGGDHRRAGAAGVRRAARLRGGVRSAAARRRVAAASGPHRAADFEELRGWLRSLVRSAPEPEAGARCRRRRRPRPRRLPIVRRRGELVRRRRAAWPRRCGARPPAPTEEGRPGEGHASWAPTPWSGYGRKDPAPAQQA